MLKGSYQQHDDGVGRNGARNASLLNWTISRYHEYRTYRFHGCIQKLINFVINKRSVARAPIPLENVHQSCEGVAVLQV